MGRSRPHDEDPGCALAEPFGPEEHLAAEEQNHAAAVELEPAAVGLLEPEPAERGHDARGLGAWELAARYSNIVLNDENIRGNSLTDMFGMRFDYDFRLDGSPSGRATPWEA